MDKKKRKFRHAQMMRKKPTLGETLLWDQLKEKQLEGVKFRRQVVILGYIVDFYSPSHRIVVEVDGPHHEDQEEYDQERDKALKKVDLHVLRFTVSDIENLLMGVLSKIKSEIQWSEKREFKKRKKDWKVAKPKRKRRWKHS